jgi:hypothetical protein
MYTYLVHVVAMAEESAANSATKHLGNAKVGQPGSRSMSAGAIRREQGSGGLHSSQRRTSSGAHQQTKENRAWSWDMQRKNAFAAFGQLVDLDIPKLWQMACPEEPYVR